MDAPPIQYCKTSDGVSIAYSTAGEGRPLIAMPIPGFSHAELGWKTLSAFEQLAAKYHVVTYDSRGSGLSDRSAVDFSIEAMMRDLEAVVERSGFHSFVLAAWTSAVPMAVTYAAAHPERVSHLILSDGFVKFSDFAESPAYKAGMPLLDGDWVLFTETFGQVLWAHANPEYGRRIAEFMRACCEPEAGRAAVRAWESYDVTSLLPQVAAPTLVIRSKGNRFYPIDVGQRLAAAIPNARLTLIDDITYAPVPNLIDAFVGEGQPQAAALPAGTAIILFADIADSTALTERLGDAAFRDKARALDEALRRAITSNGGTAIEGKLLGDGVLATFGAAREAIACAAEMHRLAAEAGGGLDPSPMTHDPLSLHVGIHAGDVLREEGNVYGGAVNIASRVASEAGAGETLVSATVRELARTSAGPSAEGFEDRGDRELKGVSEAVRLWAVREQG